MAFNIASQAANTKQKTRKNVLLITGSLALGGGVWSMHFIGMLAFELCTQISYNVSITLLSALPGVAASWVALHLLTKETVSSAEIMKGGVLMGTGIGSMHYIGMAAMDMAPLLRYDLSIFLFSIFIAILLSMLSLWVKFGIRASMDPKQFSLKHVILASVIMGLAIAGMHYTGMAAARFVLPPGVEQSSQSSDITTYLAVATTVVTMVLIMLASSVSVLFKYRDIMQRALTSEKFLKAISDVSVEAIITFGDDGIVRSANPTAEVVYGYKVSELIGMNVNELMYQGSLYPYGPSETNSQCYTKVVRKDDEIIPVNAKITHAEINDYPISISLVSDLRMRDAIESQLKESEAKFSSLISNLPGVLYRLVTFPNQQMAFLSDAFKELTGYDPEEFLSSDNMQSIASLYHPEDREVIKEKRESDGVSYLEYRIITKSKDVKWVCEYWSVVKSECGKEEYIDGFISDITQKKEMEFEIEMSRKNSQDASKSKAAFFANISHEIRTPINTIISYSNLMLDETISQDQKAHLSIINRHAQSLMKVLNAIIDRVKEDK